MVEMNPIALLETIVQERNWYQGSNIDRIKASNCKKMLAKKQLSHEKASEILSLIGYQKVKDEVWTKKTPT